MTKLWSAASWTSRLILVPPLAIFTMIAVRHLAEPHVMATQQGLAFVSPIGLTVFRAVFAGFPLSCAAFLAYCLLSNRRTLDGLVLSAMIAGIVVAIRIYGMNVDGTVQQSMALVKDETVLLAVSIIGLALELGTRARRSRASGLGFTP